MEKIALSLICGTVILGYSAIVAGFPGGESGDVKTIIQTFLLISISFILFLAAALTIVLRRKDPRERLDEIIPLVSAATGITSGAFLVLLPGTNGEIIAKPESTAKIPQGERKKTVIPKRLTLSKKPLAGLIREKRLDVALRIVIAALTTLLVAFLLVAAAKFAQAPTSFEIPEAATEAIRRAALLLPATLCGTIMLRCGGRELGREAIVRTRAVSSHEKIAALDEWNDATPSPSSGPSAP
jgi:hypothetical protein